MVIFVMRMNFYATERFNEKKTPEKKKNQSIRHK